MVSDSLCTWYNADWGFICFPRVEYLQMFFVYGLNWRLFKPCRMFSFVRRFSHILWRGVLVLFIGRVMCSGLYSEPWFYHGWIRRSCTAHGRKRRVIWVELCEGTSLPNFASFVLRKFSTLVPGWAGLVILLVVEQNCWVERELGKRVGRPATSLQVLILQKNLPELELSYLSYTNRENPIEYFNWIWFSIQLLQTNRLGPTNLLWSEYWIEYLLSILAQPL